MNPSKFINVVGEEQKEKYLNCSLTSVSTEGRYLAVNEHFLAMSWEKMGEIVIVDSSKFCSIKQNQSRIKGHKANILDLEFSPFCSNILAATFDDNDVLLYNISEDNLREDKTKEIQIYQKHKKKVPFVTFNPVASDVISSADFLANIHIWNALKGESFVEFNADGTPTSLQWNPNGSLIGATTKTKTINIFDPRSDKMIMNHIINAGFQSSKFSWVDNNQFVTTSWDKNRMKMMKLWDIRKVKNDLSSEGEITGIKLGTSTTISTPFIDKESKLIFIIAKGETLIRTYDYSQGTFLKGIDFCCSEPNINTVMFNRKNLDYNKLEIDRFASYKSSGKVYYISYILPRRNPGYDPSLYPPVYSGEAALTYDQWLQGQNSEPIKKEIHTIDDKIILKDEKLKEQEKKIEVQNNNEEITKLRNELTKANKIIETQKLTINELQNKLNNYNKNIDAINNLQNIINQKDMEINNLKSQLNKAVINNTSSSDNININIKEMMCVNFISTDQMIHYAVPCIPTNTFAEIEELLYQQYPKYRETNNTFIANGILVLRFKTIAENKIGKGLPVTLVVPE